MSYTIFYVEVYNLFFKEKFNNVINYNYLFLNKNIINHNYF